MRSISMLAAGLVLTSCVPPPTERPVGYGYQYMPPPAQEVAAAPAAPSAGRVRTFRGRGDGANLVVTLTPLGRGATRVSAGISGDRMCMGSIEGVGRREGNQIIVTPREAPQCRLRISDGGRTIAVSEDNCMEMHGAACAFTGSAALAR